MVRRTDFFAQAAYEDTVNFFYMRYIDYMEFYLMHRRNSMIPVMVNLNLTTSRNAIVYNSALRCTP